MGAKRSSKNVFHFSISHFVFFKLILRSNFPSLLFFLILCFGFPYKNNPTKISLRMLIEGVLLLEIYPKPYPKFNLSKILFKERIFAILTSSIRISLTAFYVALLCLIVCFLTKNGGNESFEAICVNFAPGHKEYYRILKRF